MKGSITAFLCMMMVIILGFLLVVIEGIRIQVSKTYGRGATDVAVESIFAEYHREMFSAFHIFTIDASYEKEVREDKTFNHNIEKRLDDYTVGEAVYQIEEVQWLTDGNGRAFQTQVTRYMMNKIGLSHLELEIDDSEQWKNNKEQGANMEVESENTMKKLEYEVELAKKDKEEKIPKIKDNPLDTVIELKSSGVLSLIVNDEMSLSDYEIDIKNMPSNRVLNEGNMPIVSGKKSVAKIAMIEYILEHFHSAVAEEQSSTDLKYELEYILEGKDSDKGNLVATIDKLILMRMPTNYICIQGSSVKQAEVEGLALTLATAATVPYLQPLFKQALILGWSYGESVMDVRSLFDGHKVTLIKQESDWQLQLSSLLTLGKNKKISDGKDMEGGLDYESYLRILLYLEDLDRLSMRSLDLIEFRIRNSGQEYFRIDGCVSAIKVKATHFLKRGYTYEFPVTYGYQ